MSISSKPTLCVALIVKNEQLHLASCLDSVKDWVDEIVILDSGSTDQTEAIARQYTDKFYTTDDWPGFGPQRQRAQAYIHADHVLWLDADEQVTPELRQSIEAVLHTPQNDTIYTVNRLSVFLNTEIRHSGWYPDNVARFYKTQSTTYNDALVHEKVITKNFNIASLDGDLIHYPYDNIAHYLSKSVSYAKSWSEDRFSKGKRANLLAPFTHAISCFIKMYLIKRGFLDGKTGFILAALSSFSAFNKYLCLWEKSYHNK
ncbi:glycosyltransferase family 2 protein [Photobacterium japonica]|uniref:glycosyltransferase family 2 protein n=1 Tax=Photobacterium japonica TaxID=2910235 RepID=UPI003D14A503